MFSFIAPELLDKKHYDHKIDIYSLGAIFYYFLFGKLP